MSRKRIKKAKQISSTSINVRVEVKSKSVKVTQSVTLITPSCNNGKCHFTWIFSEGSSKW